MYKNNCGYCGFSLNSYDLLKCMACEYEPWFQHMPYPDEKYIKKSNEYEIMAEYNHEGMDFEE